MVVVGGAGKGGKTPSSCASLIDGHASKDIASATAIAQRLRDFVRCIRTSLNWNLTHTSSNERKEAVTARWLTYATTLRCAFSRIVGKLTAAPVADNPANLIILKNKKYFKRGCVKILNADERRTPNSLSSSSCKRWSVTVEVYRRKK
jgi:hypothetical protein